MRAMNVMPQLPSDGDHTGRDLGAEELELVRQVLETGTLFSPKGKFVATFQNNFAARYGMRHAYACCNGSAAVQCAVAAINPDPGDEIITTPITDMGALSAILFQGAVPVFCDVDPDSYNVTAETIAPRITSRTRAVIVTHLFGVPCDMGPIMELCTSRGIPVIEDCAQAFDALYRDNCVGTFGAVSCYSFQQGKHMTTGEGGIVMTNDPDLARRIYLFINKGWGYGDTSPDHEFLAPNYRMNEITGAVAIAQLAKLGNVVSRRKATAALFTGLIADIPGITPQKRPPDSSPVYWKYCVNVDESAAGVSLDTLAARMKKGGVFAGPRYIGKPAFECRIFREMRTFGGSRWPYSHPGRAGLPPVDHDRNNFPGAVKALSQVLVIPWNEFYTDQHVVYIAETLRAAVEEGVRV